MFASNEEDHEGFYRAKLHRHREMGLWSSLGCLCFVSTCFGCLLLAVKNEVYC